MIRVVTVLALFILAVSSPARSVAQAAEADTIRRANALAAEGEHAAAVRVLRRAQIDTPSPQVDLNLAISFTELGRLRQARDLLWRVIASDANPLLVETAREQLRTVEARLPMLTVHIDDDASELRVDSRTVRVDGSVAYLDLDPGAHHLELRGPDGAVVASADVELALAERAEVTMRPRPERPSRTRQASEPSIAAATIDRPQRDRPEGDRPEIDPPQADSPEADLPEADLPAEVAWRDDVVAEQEEVRMPEERLPQELDPRGESGRPEQVARPEEVAAAAGLAAPARPGRPLAASQDRTAEREDSLVWILAGAGAAAAVIGVVVTVAVVAAAPPATMSDVPPVWVGG